MNPRKKTNFQRQEQTRTNSSKHNFKTCASAGETNSRSAPASEDILTRSVQRSGLPYDSFVRLIVQSALGRLSIWTQADLERLLLTAERLGLDPLSNEIYALEKESDKTKKPQIIFVVGVDGWTKIINSHPQFDGMKFFESEPGSDGLPLFFECTIYRKDRKVATSVREYMYEVHTNQGAWLTHPRRMLRHKAMVQCARVCFGLSGIYDPDEAFRVSKQVGGNFNQKSIRTAAENDSQLSEVMLKPFGASQLKSWILHAGKCEGQPSL
jgi:phage recombination protein Bet